MPETIRVLQFLDDAEPGGGMTHLLQLARWMDPARVRLVFALPPKGPAVDALRQRGFLVHAVDICWRFDPQGVLRLARLCRDEGIQILHSHNARANLHARLAGRLAGVTRVVSTVHNSVFNYEVSPRRQRLYAAAERWTARWAARIVAVSEGIAEDLVSRYRIPSDRVIVIPNGIDLEQLRPRRPTAAVRAEFNVPDRVPLVLQVGRMTDQKGFDILLEALARVRRSIPEVRLLCVGGGPRRAALESQATRLGLDECVRFLGHRDDVPDLLAAADLVTVASRSEGMPYTLLEAMGLGRPVVATRVSGILDVVEDGKTGLLVPAEDPDALAGAMVSLLKEPSRGLALGETARARILGSFTAERMAASLTALYESVLRTSNVNGEFHPSALDGATRTG